MTTESEFWKSRAGLWKRCARNNFVALALLEKWFDALGMTTVKSSPALNAPKPSSPPSALQLRRRTPQ